MTISKQRKDKRKKSHYVVKAAVFVLEGGHPEWLPKNDKGNLHELNERCKDLKLGYVYVTRPRKENVPYAWRFDARNP
jgi:hypothetical protein